MWTIVWLFLCSVAVTGSTHFDSTPKTKSGGLPNFVVMLMDDMGWGDLGCNGEPNLETPNIDRMAREGLVATNMYTAAPLCSPSRAALLTGRLPVRNGFYTDNIDGRNSYTPQEIVGGISREERLLSELLREANYTSALIGKWHLGHHDDYLPLKRGFDSFFGSTNCHFGPYDNIHTPNIPVFKDDVMIGRYFEEFAIDKKNHVSYMTKYYTDEAVKFINLRATSEDPFFLMWTPDSTHAVTYASPSFKNSSRRGDYGDAVRELDYGVGRILSELERTGQSEDTLVIFSSDNGAALVSKFDGGSNGPFLCGKQTTFEGGMRAPGIFWWPGTIKPGTVTAQVWNHMDFLPTFLQLAGVSTPDDRILDGLPLANVLINPEINYIRPTFLYRGNRLMAVRMGSYKMHLWTWHTTPEELGRGIDFCPGQRTENITTEIPFDHTSSPILYNIDKDQGERYPIPPWNDEYKNNIQQLLDAVEKHNDELVLGEPVLNWCDSAVMHWSPPGCEALGKCLTVPPSNPYLCDWPH